MRILNFGSMNIDYVYSVPHIVRPGETLSATRLSLFSGGKGLNQSVAAARAGATVFHAAFIGSDGDLLRHTLEESGVDLAHLRETDANCGHAIIQVDAKGQNCIVIYAGANAAMTREYVDEVLAQFEKDDIVLVQNETSQVPYIIEKAHARGMTVALNPSPITPGLLDYPLEGVGIFLLNEIEGKAICQSEDTRAVAEMLCRRFPRAEIVLTLGKEGALYCHGSSRVRHGIYDVPVVDTTGAGDTFCGYFLAGRSLGLAPEECIRRASVASSIVVSRNGAAASIPTLQQVLAFRAPEVTAG